MAFRIVPFQADHLAVLAPGTHAPHVELLEVPDLAWTCLDPTGKPIAGGGLIPQMPGYCKAWFIPRGVPRRAWGAIQAKVRWVLAEAQKRGWVRIEAAIDPRDPRACRFASKFGFAAYGMLERMPPFDIDMIGVALVTPRHSAARPTPHAWGPVANGVGGAAVSNGAQT